MSMERCDICVYYSPRGSVNEETGKWEQRKINGELGGVCRRRSPALNDGHKVFPYTNDGEVCGEFVFDLDRCYKPYIKRWYEVATDRCRELHRQLDKHKLVHERIGSMAVLVGMRPNQRRLNILDAIERALRKENHGKEEQEKAAQV